MPGLLQTPEYARVVITIQVLRAIEHPTLVGSFSILEFEPPAQSFVYLENYELADMAFGESDSREFLARLATWYERDSQ